MVSLVVSVMMHDVHNMSTLVTHSSLGATATPPPRNSENFVQNPSARLERASGALSALVAQLAPAGRSLPPTPTFFHKATLVTVFLCFRHKTPSEVTKDDTNSHSDCANVRQEHLPLPSRVFHVCVPHSCCRATDTADLPTMTLKRFGCTPVHLSLQRHCRHRHHCTDRVLTATASQWSSSKRVKWPSHRGMSVSDHFGERLSLIRDACPARCRRHHHTSITNTVLPHSTLADTDATISRDTLL